MKPSPFQSSPAQYLLRFDDLCPMMARERWERFLPLIAEFGIRPTLAVVPDNRDHELEHSAPDPEFWSQMRAMETAGATIGLHGYRHICGNRGRSLVPLHRKTEFAGVPEKTQRVWIREGLAILRGRGLSPRIWVAPCHGTDRATLRVLREEGIGLVSDGLARVPFMREGLTWIPQQLWEPVEKASGLWTICVHSNTAPDSLVEKLREFLGRHAGQFTTVDRVVAEFTPQEFGLTERVSGWGMWLRMRGSQFRGKMSRLRERLGME
jgi:predicted deacetylase